MNTLLEKPENKILPEFMATTKLKATNSFSQEMSLTGLFEKIVHIYSFLISKLTEFI